MISVSKDVSWDNIPIAYWTSIESNTGIICACLPSLKQLLSRFLPRLIHSSPSIDIRDEEEEEAWEQHRFRKSTIVAHHNHANGTASSGSGYAIGPVGLTVPLKAFILHPRITSSDITPSDMEDGGIKVTTVIEQDVGSKTEIGLWPLGR